MVVVDPLIELGKKIKEKRLSLGYSIEDVSGISRVSGKYIEAIEKSDRDNLPQEVYLVGFLSLVLKALKLNVKELIEDYKDKEINHVIQEIINTTSENSPEQPEKGIKASFKKKDEISGNYLKIYQLYLLAFLIILGFSFALIKKSGNRNFKSRKPSTEISDYVKEIPEIDANYFETEDVEEKKVEIIHEEPKEQSSKDIIRERIEKKQKKEAQKIQDTPKIQITQKPVSQTIFKTLETEEKPSKVKSLASIGKRNLKIKVRDTAWLQITGIGSGKVFYEGDVSPEKEPSQFNLYDSVGFALATGNAGAFIYDTDRNEGYRSLGAKDQLVKWYYPKAARVIYKSRNDSGAN